MMPLFFMQSLPFLFLFPFTFTSILIELNSKISDENLIDVWEYFFFSGENWNSLNV
jgi:hypothetical protein